MATCETERISIIIYNAFISGFSDEDSIEDMVEIISFYEKVNLQALVAIEVFNGIYGSLGLVDKATNEVYSGLEEKFGSSKINFLRRSIQMLVTKYLNNEKLFEIELCKNIESLSPEKRFYYEQHKMGD